MKVYYKGNYEKYSHSSEMTVQMRGDFMENEEQKKGIGVTLKIREGES